MKNLYKFTGIFICLKHKSCLKSGNAADSTLGVVGLIKTFKILLDIIVKAGHGLVKKREGGGGGGSAVGVSVFNVAGSRPLGSNYRRITSSHLTWPRSSLIVGLVPLLWRDDGHVTNESAQPSYKRISTTELQTNQHNRSGTNESGQPSYTFVE